MADPLFTRCSKVIEGQLVHMHSPDCECYNGVFAKAQSVDELAAMMNAVMDAKMEDVVASSIEEAFIG